MRLDRSVRARGEVKTQWATRPASANAEWDMDWIHPWIGLIGGDLVQVFRGDGIGALAPKFFLPSPQNAKLGDGGGPTVPWN